MRHRVGPVLHEVIPIPEFEQMTLTMRKVGGCACHPPSGDQDSTTSGGCRQRAQQLSDSVTTYNRPTVSLALNCNHVTTTAREDVYPFVAWTASSHNRVTSFTQAACDPVFKFGWRERLQSTNEVGIPSLDRWRRMSQQVVSQTKPCLPQRP
jgi:hypothetical protein